jgi:hypothetical protein
MVLHFAITFVHEIGQACCSLRSLLSLVSLRWLRTDADGITILLLLHSRDFAFMVFAWVCSLTGIARLKMCGCWWYYYTALAFAREMSLSFLSPRPVLSLEVHVWLCMEADSTTVIFSEVREMPHSCSSVQLALSVALHALLLADADGITVLLSCCL